MKRLMVWWLVVIELSNKFLIFKLMEFVKALYYYERAPRFHYGDVNILGYTEASNRETKLT